MNDERIIKLLDQWGEAACHGMGNCLLGEASFLELTKETFRMFSTLDSNRSISNPVARILVLMQEFAVYCWFSDEANSLARWGIVSNILYGFLDGFTQRGSHYPKLKLGDEYILDHFNFDTHTLADMKMDEELPF